MTSEQQQTTSLNDVQIGTLIQLKWPNNNKWTTGEIVHDWKNGEFAIKFEDDPFDEPLSYVLNNYEWKIISQTSEKDKKKKVPRIRKKPKYESGDNRDSNPKPNDNPENMEEEGQQNGDKPVVEDEWEVEAILDKVVVPTERFRVKWKNYDLSACTWEPREHLTEAKSLIGNYNSALLQMNESGDTELLNKIRLTKDDKRTFERLWHRLTMNSKQKEDLEIAAAVNTSNSDDSKNNNIHEESSKYINCMEWTAEGNAFQINNTNLFSEWLHNTSHFPTYNSFLERCAILGFEMQPEEHLFHHPCFSKQQRRWIDSIAQNSIDISYLTSNINNNNNNKITGEKRKDKNNQIQNELDQPPNKKRKITSQQTQFEEQSQSDIQLQQQPSQSQVSNSSQLGPSAIVISMPESNVDLDMDQCHLWTEHDVSLWLENLSEYNGGTANYQYRINKEWGQFYGKTFKDHGVDGRMLLELNDVNMMAKMCEMNEYHIPVFIQAVNELRTVRSRCMGIQS